jgi:hypothetical protein
MDEQLSLCNPSSDVGPASDEKLQEVISLPAIECVIAARVSAPRTGHGPHVNTHSPTPPPATIRVSDALNVHAPPLLPIALDELVQRVHPRSRKLFVDTQLSVSHTPGPARSPVSLFAPSPLSALAPSPILTGPSLDAEAETRQVLCKINARRVIHSEHAGLHSMEEETLGNGLAVRLERGRLGLVRVGGAGGT